MLSRVRPGTLAADLGLEDGDMMRLLGTRSAAAAAREGQTGISYLIDGLDGAEVQVELIRAGALTTLRWRFE